MAHPFSTGKHALAALWYEVVVLIEDRVASYAIFRFRGSRNIPLLGWNLSPMA